MKLYTYLILALLFPVLMSAQQAPSEIEKPVPARSNKVDVAEKYAKTITSDDLKSYLSILASDEFEGRETGTKGNKKAADFIASKFENFGIPKGEDDSYFQKVKFSWTSWDDIMIYVNGERFKHLWNFISFPNQNSDQPMVKTKKVVFLGYGIDDEKYSDYKGVNVKGKVVMIYKGEPMNESGVSYITGSKEVSDWTTNIEKKLIAAKKQGVKAVLIIEDKLQEELGKYRHILIGPRITLGDDATKHEQFANSCFISTNIAKAIMGKRFGKVANAREQYLKKGKSKSVKLKAKLSLAQDKKEKKLEGENVYAYIEGSDPALKHEHIVISAHYDHLGKRGDEIYNGADDNGSGTSSVLEVAQAFAKAKKDGVGPRRSVIVMLMTGEEKGLLGSQYYTEFPIYPLENAVANINVDMVGRVDEKYKDNPNYIYVIGSDRLSTELHDINEAVNNKYTNLVLDYTYNAEDDPNRYYYRSDHYNFAEKGIPAIFYFNGTHDDYHRTSDTVEKINFEKMETIARLVFHTGWQLANQDKRIEVNVRTDKK